MWVFDSVAIPFGKVVRSPMPSPAYTAVRNGMLIDRQPRLDEIGRKSDALFKSAEIATRHVDHRFWAPDGFALSRE